MVQAAPAVDFKFYDVAAHDLVGTPNSSGANSFEALNVDEGTPVWSFTNASVQGGDDKGIGIISGSASVDYSNHCVFFASRRRSGG